MFDLHTTILALLRDHPGGLHPETLTCHLPPSCLPLDGRDARGAVHRACLDLTLARKLRRLPGGLFALPEGVVPPSPVLVTVGPVLTLTAPEPRPVKPGWSPSRQGVLL